MQSGFHVPDRHINASYTRWGMMDHYTGPVTLEYWVQTEAPDVVLSIHDDNGLIAESPVLKADEHPHLQGRAVWNRYLWNYDFSGHNGCFVLTAELIGSSIPVMPAAICCGDPIPGQPVPVVPYDDHDAGFHFEEHQGYWWIPQETAKDIKGHPIAPRFGKTDKAVDHQNLWVERMSLRQNTALQRFDLTVMPSGHFTAVPKQLYFWEDRNTLSAAATWGRDGPRDVATIGHVNAGFTHPDGYQICAQSQGRVFRLDDDGTVTTLFGWCLKTREIPRDWEHSREDKEFLLSHLEYVGNKKPEDPEWREIFHVSGDPDNPDMILVSDVGNNCLWYCNIQTGDMRRIGGPDEGLVNGPASQAKFRKVRCAHFRPGTRDVYIADEYNQSFRKWDTVTDEVSTVVRSKVIMSDSHGSLNAMGTDTGPMRKMMAIDGVFGECSFAHPNQFKFNSEGLMIASFHHIMTIGEVDLNNQTLKHVHNYSYFNVNRTYRLLNGWITLDIDTAGSSGPKDAIYCTAWSHDTDICLTKNADGTYTEQRITEYRRMKDSVAWEGPMWNSMTFGYPWGAWVDPRGAIYVATTSGEGVMRITPKRDDDPVLDIDRYKRGGDIWDTPHPPKGTLRLKYGVSGQNNLGPISASTFGDLDESQALDLMESEFGVRDTDLLYYLWWNSADGRTRLQGKVPEPMPDPVPVPDPAPIPDPQPEPKPDPSVTQQEALAAIDVISRFVNQ